MPFCMEPFAKDVTQKRKYQPNVRAGILPAAGLGCDGKGQVTQVWEHQGKKYPSGIRAKAPAAGAVVRLFDCKQQKPVRANVCQNGFVGRVPSSFTNQKNQLSEGTGNFSCAESEQREVVGSLSKNGFGSESTPVRFALGVTLLKIRIPGRERLIGSAWVTRRAGRGQAGAD